MKKWAYHLFFKIICVILATLSLTVSILSAFGILLMLDQNGYRRSYDSLETDYLTGAYHFLLYEVASEYDSYLYSDNTYPDFRSYLQALKSEYDFYCCIRNKTGQILYYGDYEGQSHILCLEESVFVSGDWETVEGETYSKWVPREYQVTIYVGSLTDDQETSLGVLKVIYRHRTLLIPTFFVSLVLFLLLAVFLCFSSGRKGEREEIFLGFFHRIPLELIGLFAFLLCLFEGWLLNEVFFSYGILLITSLVSVVIDAALFCLILMTFSARIKGGVFYRYTLTRHGVFLLKKLGKALFWFLENLALVPKLMAILICLAILNLFFATSLMFSEYLVILLVEGIALSAVLAWYGASIQGLQKDLKKLSEGKVEHRCDVTRLPPGLRSFGEEINRSAEGMEYAVEEKMKSERFKTELIANVSHDIKTPLTSIISYVDLMKKEEPESERMKEYLAVLERQSARLKKLAEDLVESSKAASGILPVELAPCDLRVLMEQALGEYQSVFEEKGLIPVFTLPDHPLFVLADGQRLWRVLDNLMNNISKYALSGTRVLGDLEQGGDKVHLILRNISALPLTMTGEDLSERFVRGDASRNTEGSGLGLAIARSLVELQKGKMEILVDGDLFKVILTFDAIS